MGELDLLSIEHGDNGFTLNISEGVKKITDKQLLDALGVEGVSKIQKLQLAKKREQYDKLQPAGFEYAPKTAKEYRETLNDADNTEDMEYLQNNISYNSDKTVNILQLDKTFCEDISGQAKDFNYADAQKLSEETGYSLGTDYNDTDSEKEKQGSDWYKAINIFSRNNGDTKEGRVVFRDMTGCNNRYWTATSYKDENGEVVEGVVRVRILDEYNLNRDGYNTSYDNCVCGFKDSMN